MRPKPVIAALALALAATACAVPEGTSDSAEGLMYGIVRARQAGDADALWDLLHPETRALLDEWVRVEQGTARLVHLVYPDAQRGPILETLKVRGFDDGKALFRSLAGGAGQALGAMAQLGVRARSVESDGHRAKIRTWGGDVVAAERFEGRWYARLSPEATDRLRSSLARAVANRDALDKVALRLQRR